MFKKTLMGLTVLSLGLSAFAQLYDGRWELILVDERDNVTFWLDTKSITRDGVIVRWRWMSSNLKSNHNEKYQSSYFYEIMDCGRRESRTLSYDTFFAPMGFGKKRPKVDNDFPTEWQQWQPILSVGLSQWFFNKLCR